MPGQPPLPSVGAHMSPGLMDGQSSSRAGTDLSFTYWGPDPQRGGHQNWGALDLR